MKISYNNYTLIDHKINMIINCTKRLILFYIKYALYKYDLNLIFSSTMNRK